MKKTLLQGRREMRQIQWARTESSFGAVQPHADSQRSETFMAELYGFLSGSFQQTAKQGSMSDLGSKPALDRGFRRTRRAVTSVPASHPTRGISFVTSTGALSGTRS